MTRHTNPDTVCGERVHNNGEGPLVAVATVADSPTSPITCAECRAGADLEPLPRIAIFGGRNYAYRGHVWSILDRVHEHLGPFVLVHGACHCAENEPDIGVDYFADQWVTKRIEEHNDMPDPDRHPAAWDEHGRAAGPIRNREMARSGLFGAIQFPGDRGTRSMRAQCDAAAVRVWEVKG